MYSKIYFVFLLILSVSTGWSQSVLSGIINQYVAVTSIDTCRNGAQVTNASEFRAGGQAILIQMKGATIDTDDSSAFGNVTDLGQAGIFEKVVIDTVYDNFIVFDNRLLYEYNVEGAVQLVSMPVFDRAIVREPVTARPWDGTTGGIIAFDVRGNLTLEADIDASGTGFRGGQANIQEDGNCLFTDRKADYSYPLGDWNGAAKGEGIADWLPGREAGRGAQANGGGGGNDHNSGGGGGANITNGGRGGRNAEPSFFGCKGNFPGEGGKAIFGDTTRLYLGGGGGAGDENNDVATDGGVGGGIIILSARSIAANGFSLRSNGVDAEDTIGEGAGGGGAGGTIFVQGESLTSFMIVESTGGKGGNIDNRNEDRCFGAGGGGSGGRFIGSPALTNAIALNLSGGRAGVSMNSGSGSCGDAENLAQDGENGLREDKNSLAESQIPYIRPAVGRVPVDLTACEEDALRLSVPVQGEELQFQWQQQLDGGNYIDLPDSPPYRGVFSPELFIDPVSDNGQEVPKYRLQVTTVCGDLLYSDSITFSVEALPDVDFSYTLDDFTLTLVNQSDGAESYTWLFGDENGSDEENPVHTYNEIGNYEVALIARNACGSDTLKQLLNVEVGVAPTAAFSFEPLASCSPLKMQFTNESRGDYTNILWRFPGGEPTTSNDANPEVTYAESGIYSFTLLLSGEVGQDSLVLEENLEVLTPPVADF
jgi:PKD repeat protein